MRAASAHAYAYWMSFIGNVLGTPGQMTGWTYDAISGTNNIPPRAIWMLGWMDITPQGYDPNVAATAIRDGNYDYVTNKVAWAATDTAHTLPNSLYLTQKPAFFSAGSKYTWPWVECRRERPRLLQVQRTAGQGALRRRDAVHAALSRRWCRPEPSRAPDAKRRAAAQERVSLLATMGYQLINNNRALFLPLQDQQAIEIALFLVLVGSSRGVARPISSANSRRAAASGVSPRLTPPPGKFHLT